MMIDRTDGEDRPVDEEMGKTHYGSLVGTQA